MKMDLPMARTAKGDEIFFHIASQKAARLPMMDLQILRPSAALAPPANPLTAARPIVVAHYFLIDPVCAGVADFVLNRVIGRQHAAFRSLQAICIS